MAYDYLRFPDFRRLAFTMSYDDGNRHDLKLLSIMGEHGLRGTFNLCSSFLNREDTLSDNDVREKIIGGGHEVAVHGYHHFPLAVVPTAAATADLIEDRIHLEALTGKIIRGMAYANGSVNDRAVELLRQCGLVYGRTVASTEQFALPHDWLRLPATCHHANPRLQALADAFLAPPAISYFTAHAPRLFYVWGHSFEFANNDNWQIIDELGKKVGHRDDVWYATNLEIYEYVEAYDRLVFDAKWQTVYNPTQIDIFFCRNGKEQIFPAGKITELV